MVSKRRLEEDVEDRQSAENPRTRRKLDHSFTPCFEKTSAGWQLCGQPKLPASINAQLFAKHPPMKRNKTEARKPLRRFNARPAKLAHAKYVMCAEDEEWLARSESQPAQRQQGPPAAPATFSFPSPALALPPAVAKPQESNSTGFGSMFQITFGTGAPAFGQPPKQSAPTFGKPAAAASQPAFQFGPKAPTFGTNNQQQTPAFGTNPQQQAPPFGANPQQQAPAFGANQQQQQQAPPFGLTASSFLLSLSRCRCRGLLHRVCSTSPILSQTSSLHVCTPGSLVCSRAAAKACKASCAVCRPQSGRQQPGAIYLGHIRLHSLQHVKASSRRCKPILRPSAT
ncbi:hypothetical protein WJX73_007618 [Symbiochloris irregularis]|uniref:Uncharacterized protein n=1 Tax=Symbiochloris irregularis TaxID=706552 RepID=A0AAW1P3W0_9CHLO